MLITREEVEAKYFAFQQTRKLGRNLKLAMAQKMYWVPGRGVFGKLYDNYTNVFGEAMLNNPKKEEILDTLLAMDKISVVNYNLLDFCDQSMEGEDLFKTVLDKFNGELTVDLTENCVNLIRFLGDFNEETYKGKGVECPRL